MYLGGEGSGWLGVRGGGQLIQGEGGGEGGAGGWGRGLGLSLGVCGVGRDGGGWSRKFSHFPVCIMGQNI